MVMTNGSLEEMRLMQMVSHAVLSLEARERHAKWMRCRIRHLQVELAWRWQGAAAKGAKWFELKIGG